MTRLFGSLQAKMATVLAEDVHASFPFGGDLNCHYQEWLGFTTTNRHGVGAFVFTTVSDCDQLVVAGTLDLLMTDIPDQV